MYRLLFIIFLFYTSLFSFEKVSIQLKWKHSFQFAGYYAALEKGFYKEAGLDVTLKEVDFSKDFVKSVADGESEYGVGDSSLVVYRSNGTPIVLVTQIFQHSPLVFLSHRDSDIITPYDMVGKRVMFSLHKGGDAPFRALILKTIGDLNKVDIYDFTSYQDFIDRRVDVISAYSTNQPYWLKKKGVEVNIIDPKSYGIDFYGDNFFTSKKELREHPKRVELVRKATLKGWKYALEHQDEIIDLIIKKYATNMSKDQLKFQARGIFQMIMPDLIELGSYRDDRYEQVIKTYHQLGMVSKDHIDSDFFYHPPKEQKIYTKEELKWIEKNPLVLVGGGPDWAPFDFVENGKYTGIANDFLSLISKKSGLKFKVIVDKWSNNLKKMKEAKIDLLDAVYFTEDRAKFMNFTKPYFEMLDYFFIRDDLKVESLKDLDGKRVAMPRGYAHAQILKKEFPKIKIVWVDTFLEAIDAVLQKRADALFDTYISISYVLKKNSISTIIPFKPYRGKEVKKLHMATVKTKSMLNTIIDKALSSISDQERDRIYKKWIKDPIDQSIKLTKEEREYLLQNRDITFTGDPNWLPFEAFDNDGKYIGIVADYLKELERLLPIKFHPRVVKSWQETLDLSKNKKVDVISGDIDDVVLSKNYYPIKPYFKTPIVMIMRDDNSFVDDLDELKDKKIAIVKGYGYVSELKKRYKDINFLEAEDVDQLLDGVSSGEFDVALLSMPTAAYMIKTKGYQNLKIVGKTSVVMKVTLFVLKSKPLLHSILQKAISSFDYKKSHQIAGKWQKVEFAKKIDYTLVYQIASAFVVFVLISLFWTRKLSLEIKERRRVEEELKKARQKALEASVAKGEFLANMSHEIRTPMNSIIGFSELLAKQIKDPVHKDYLNSIIKGGEALLSIINDILDLSKIEAGKLEIVLESTDIKELAKEMESIFSIKMIQKNLHFKLDIDESIPRYLLLDATRVRQILFNLIGNAVKFTNHGSITLSVKKLKEDRKKGKIDLLLSVKDSGIGIKKEDLEDIFLAFKQQDGQDSAKYGGTGLGLAICKKLVDMMGGEISVESKEGKGSKFSIVLKDVSISSLEADKKRKSDFDSDMVFNADKVLVVDDVDDNIKLVSSLLQLYGLKVVEAKNGKEAVDKIKQESDIKLVLMDLKMPVMDGYEATDIIKSDKKLLHIPVVALTASVFGEDIKKIEKTGFDGYLKKPITSKELLKEIGRFVPYKSIKIKKSSKELDIDKDRLKELVLKLENEFLPRSIEIKDMGDFSVIEEFADSVDMLADEFGADMLKSYAKELKEFCNSFDIEGVDFMINSFASVVDEIKGYKIEKNSHS